MHDRDVMWMIGGPQGSGINVAAETFAKACITAGLRVFTNIEYHSNIMGEHSYYRVRAGTRDRKVLSDRVHVLVSLDEETLTGDPHNEFKQHTGHLSEVVPGGAIVYDAALKRDPAKAADARTDIRYYAVPYDQLLRQAIEQSGHEGQVGRLRVIANTIAVGASLGLLGFDIEIFNEVVRAGFKGRRSSLADLNTIAARLGYDYIRGQLSGEFAFTLPKTERPARVPMMIRGSVAVGIAKLKAGLGLQTYYPISPATDESVYLEANARDHDLLVVQCEDEISSINMAVGAAHAGVRVATSTSGPGLSLMAEGIGFASMTEAPGPVLFLWQRGGPSTGLPTRQEQADLKLALSPGHGDMPHIVVAPGDTQEMIEDSFECFNWADRYQMPVIVVVDKYLSTSYATVDEISFEGMKIDRGLRWQKNGDEDYLRYRVTENGISPRATPGQEGGIFWSTTDEHDPRGHITEAPDIRIAMMEKRMGKLELAGREIPMERQCRLYGPEGADYTLVAWGSTKGAILEALDQLAEDGVTCNFLQIRVIRPFPVAEVTRVLGKAKRTILVENNYTGMLGDYIREQTGITLDSRVVKYDGRPFSQEELIEALREAMTGNKSRVHVSHLSA
ncbi:MAG: 2-oxoacid:acceptor oxidoreductase subunit alpha [Chloroflexi bacterium]|nr:2-oxoacid:acceptor oxidoreductase subunit alpha [Chloroflexota bacterium]